MPNVGDLTVKIKGDAKSLESALDTASSKLKATGDKMKSMGNKMTLGVTAPIAGIGIGAIMTGAKFEKGMNRVKALSGATGKEFDALKQQAKDLGSSTMFSATEASEAMGFLAMAGFKTNEVIGVMPGVLNLAAAAQMDLGQAADITSNIMTGFGIEVKDLDRMNDALVKGMTSANVDLQMMGESMKYVGPVAKAAGMEFEETAAAVALLGDAGIQGSMAGTSLRGAMTRLLNPSESAASLMEDLGINALDSEGNLKSFTDIIRELENANIGAGDAMAIFGQRAGPAMLQLVDTGSTALADLTQSLRDSGGAAESVASIQMEGMSGAITEMKSAFEAMMIAISEDVLPVFTRLIDAVTPILQGFANMPGPVKLIIIVIGGLAAVMGPLLIALGMMMPAIAALGPVFALMGSGMIISTIATWAQTVAMAALSLAMSPVTLAILGIAAAIAVVILVWKNWDKIVSFFGEAFNKVKEVFSEVSQKVEDVLMSKWGWLLPGGLLLRAFKLVRDNWEDIWAAIRVLAVVAWEKISTKFTKHFGWMLPGGAIHKALVDVRDKFMDIWDSIKEKFDSVAKFVFDIWDTHFGWMRPGGAIFTALDKLKDKWSAIWRAIGGAVKGPINLVLAGVNKIIDTLNGLSFGWEGKKVRGVTVLPSFEFEPFNIPNVPLLAKGGIVSSPTLAMIGERGPEAVVPLGRGGGMGTTVVININGPTYGFDDFEKKVARAIRDGVRRGGFQGILSPVRG
jgi:TP901 family phage tail tape measure protein